jgi:hypothetical protein
MPDTASGFAIGIAQAWYWALTRARRQSRMTPTGRSSTIGTVTDAKASPPPGYQEPLIAWLVEYTDAREPGSRFQAGAFTTEPEAQKLLGQLSASGIYGEMWINMVPVHRMIQDWEWDR